MAGPNKHGLSRYIKAPIRAAVRERCGYGCVICGSIPIDYAHLIVPFNEALEHNSDDIVTLCLPHHRQYDNGLIDVEMIQTALRLSQGVNSDTRFKLAGTKPDFVVDWCGTKIFTAENAIIIDERPLLTFQRSDNPLEPILISGAFNDLAGNLICEIVNNEFVMKSDALGDITLVKNRFEMRLRDGKKGLSFELSPGVMRITYIFHADRDAYVYGKGQILRAGNLFNGLEHRNMDIRVKGSRAAIKLGTCTNRFSFADHDIEKMPINTRIYNGTIDAGTVGGIYLAGRRPLPFTSNYDRPNLLGLI